MFFSEYYVRASFGSESVCPGVKNKDVVLEVLQYPNFTEAGMSLFQKHFLMISGGNGANFHDFWCFGHEQGW